MKLYLLRHGERGHGPEQDTLTKVGLEQARITAPHFKNIKIDKIISASLNRGKKTAEEVLKVVRCEIEYTKEVNEQSLGDLEGKTGSEYREALNKSGLDSKEFRPNNGENRYDAYERAKIFFEKLKKEAVSSILIVSHSGFISDLITLLLRKPMEESKNFKTQFCAISYFDLDEDFNVKEYSVNDVSHLSKNLQ